VGGGGAGSATIVITGGSVYSVNSSTPERVRINFNPTNGSALGSRLVYMVGVRVVDTNNVMQPGTTVSIYVPAGGGGPAYTYTATTNANGIAYMWLPAGYTDAVVYDPVTGHYMDFVYQVLTPANPAEYDPLTNTFDWQLDSNKPDWSFTEIPNNVKVYGTALLDVNINHNNIGNHANKQIAGVRWFRESVENPVSIQSTFNAGYNAATSTNRGVGGYGEALAPIGTYNNNLKHFQMPINRNGRYWIEIHYKGANTGRDVIHVAYLDVTNIYTPVDVYVQDLTVTNEVIQSYTRQDTPLVYGVPLDMNGTALTQPAYGYDTVTYQRNPNYPASHWNMTVPGSPFASTLPGAASSTITLNSLLATNEDNTVNSDATHYYYTVKYGRNSQWSLLTAYFVNSAGGSIQVPGGSGTTSANIWVPLDSNGLTCTAFKANGGVFIPPTDAVYSARGYYVRTAAYQVDTSGINNDQSIYYAQADFADFNPQLVFLTPANGTLAGNNKLYIVFSQPAATFTFTKVNQSGTAMPGVSFAIYQCSNNGSSHTAHDWLVGGASNCWLLRSTTTSSSPLGKVSFTNLEQGEYMLVETQTLPGYQLPHGQWLISVDLFANITIMAHGIDGSPQSPGATLPPAFRVAPDGSLSLPNYLLTVIPLSGGMGVLLSTSSGAAMIGTAVSLVLVPKARKKKTRQQ
jgi:hypothetical protein